MEFTAAHQPFCLLTQKKITFPSGLYHFVEPLEKARIEYNEQRGLKIAPSFTYFFMLCSSGPIHIFLFSMYISSLSRNEKIESASVHYLFSYIPLLKCSNYSTFLWIQFKHSLMWPSRRSHICCLILRSSIALAVQDARNGISTHFLKDRQSSSVRWFWRYFFLRRGRKTNHFFI